jgi:hypothetical protein
LRELFNGPLFDDVRDLVVTDPERVVQVTPENTWGVAGLGGPVWPVEGGEDTHEPLFLLGDPEWKQELAPKLTSNDGPRRHNQWNIGRTPDGEAFPWWLRSPGSLPANAANVGADGDPSHDTVVARLGVRPALWLNLPSGICESAHPTDTAGLATGVAESGAMSTGEDGPG